MINKDPGKIYLSQETVNTPSFLRYLIPLLFMFMITAAYPQQQFNIIDSLYGADPLLVNGRYYSFFPPPNTANNQYLEDTQFQTGSLTLRGKTWSGLMLNYDIYNQQLIMSFRNKTGANNLIVISDAWLEKFSIRGMTFEIVSLQDSVKSIVQIIGSGPVRIGYLWRKDITPDSFHGARYYSFSSPGKENLILERDRVARYINNRTFCRALDPRRRKVVMEYLKKNRIRVRKADDRTMSTLLDFYNSTVGK
jgi:hypothetical protein